METTDDEITRAEKFLEAAPTILEIRDALRQFGAVFPEAIRIFEGRLTLDPKGKGWGWDALRMKVIAAIESMKDGRWEPVMEIRIPANSIAEAVEQTQGIIPEDVLEALGLYDGLGKAIGATNILTYGAEQLPDKRPTEEFAALMEKHRHALEAIRARMEHTSDDGPKLVVKRHTGNVTLTSPLVKA